MFELTLENKNNALENNDLENIFDNKIDHDNIFRDEDIFDSNSNTESAISSAYTTSSETNTLSSSSYSKNKKPKDTQFSVAHNTGEKTQTPENLNAGHRSRLRERFAKAPESLPDYELLELLLFLALPRQDVKPLAKKLLKQFKTLNHIVCTELTALTNIQGLGHSTALVIKVVHEFLARINKEELKAQPLLNSQSQVVNYLKVAMAYLHTEQFRVLFLNKKYYLILDEVQQKGTLDQVALYCREIIRRAIEIGASSIILVHNHPTGDPTPSKADIDSTLLLKQAGEHMDVQLLDHIVIGKFGFVSMHDLGII